MLRTRSNNCLKIDERSLAEVRTVRHIAIMAAASVIVSALGLAQTPNALMAEPPPIGAPELTTQSTAGLNSTPCSPPRSGAFRVSSGISYNCEGTGSTGKWVRISRGNLTSLGSDSPRSAHMSSGINGTKCSRANLSRTAGGVRYICVKEGRNLKWRIAGKTQDSSSRGNDVIVPEISATLVSNVGNSKTTRLLGIRALLPEAGTQIPVARIGKQSSMVCRTSGELIEFLSEGNCDVRLELKSRAAGVRVVVKKLLPRTEIDRPGANLLDIKPIYITFKNGADEGYDTSGLLATMVSSIADFYAEQRPGFELRVDTYEGLPDIQHIQLPITREEFLANWNTTYGPLPQYLKQMGIDLNIDSATGVVRSYETTNRIYIGIIETVTGGREGFASGHTKAGCWSEALPGGGVMFYARDSENKPCTERFETLKYRGSKDTQFDFDNLRRIYGGSGLRSMPGCDATFRAFYMKTPDQTDESLVKPNDPVRYPYVGPKNPPWVMDEDGRYYLRIKDGPRVGNPCYDIAYSSFFMRMGSSIAQNDSVAGRITIDRPDDSAAPQVKAYYVLAADSVDDRFDVGGQISKQITSANEWLYSNGGKRLRWDTFNGAIDVQFVRLKQTEAELWMDPDDPSKKCRFKQCPSLETIVLAMQSQGIATRSKITAVFYGGQRSFASHYDVPWCAWGGIGKAGHVAMYLVADMNMMTGSVGCSNMNDFAKTPNTQNTVGIVIIHEIFHALGLVAFSGPPNGDNGHIKNDPSDLMGGSQGVVRLDPGNDDYWRHGKSWADGYRSAFMEPAEPNAEFPTGW